MSRRLWAHGILEACQMCRRPKDICCCCS